MTIYTDGSCRKNKKGAYGFIVENNNEIHLIFAKKESKTTSSRMEIKAVLTALQYIKKVQIANIEIYSDNEYVTKGVNIWLKNWVANDWTKSDGSKLANIDLWKKMFNLLTDLHDNGLMPHVKWIRGHHTNKYNNFIDNIVQKLTK